MTLKNRFCLDYLNQTIMRGFPWKLVFVSLGEFKVGAVTFYFRMLETPEVFKTQPTKIL